MRLGGRKRSTNVDDRRGMPVGRRGVGIGCGGVALVIVIALLTGNDPLELLSAVAGDGASPTADVASAPRAGVDPEDPGRVFVERVLYDLEQTWSGELGRMGRTYREPTLVLFEDQVASACGFSSSAVGPFYCPADQRVYLDLGFFAELERRFGAPGDFARAYVIAHEIGHHVQNLLGISGRVRQMQQQAPRQANQLSVLLELQADCLAGVWGRQARDRGLLDPDDVEEGLRAAAAIGDDTIQRRSQGHVVPESFTHGSSQERQRWFLTGLESGDADSCDTFGG